LPDERSHIIARVLEFLYTSAYSLEANLTISGYDPVSEVLAEGSKCHGTFQTTSMLLRWRHTFSLLKIGME
jgi:hypothetical protein